jgi:hypothetical protein
MRQSKNYCSEYDMEVDGEDGEDGVDGVDGGEAVVN